MTMVDKKALRHEAYRKRVPKSYLVGFFGLVLFFVVFSYTLYGFYLLHWYGAPARFVASVLPLPAAMVEGDVIWYRDVAEFAHVFDLADRDGLLDIDDPFKEGMTRAVGNAHLRNFSEAIGVDVSREDIEAFEFSNQDLDAFLDQASWSERQYERYVIVPLLLAQMAEEVVLSDAAYQSDVYEAMEKIQQDLELGLSFDDLAKQYSEDISAESGGYSGYFREEDLPQGLEPAFSLDLFEVSDVLETNAAFYLVQPYDVVGFGDDRSQVALQVIVRNKEPLSTMLRAFHETQKVFYFVR